MNTRSFLSTTALALATAISLSACSSDDSSDNNGGDKYAYCVFVEQQACITSTLSCVENGGMLGNTCPADYSKPSSSSGGGTGGGETGSILNLPSNMSAQVYFENGTTYNGNADVKIILGNYTTSKYDTLPAGSIQNGKITWSLPTNLDSKYMQIIFSDICNYSYITCEGVYNMDVYFLDDESDYGFNVISTNGLCRVRLSSTNEGESAHVRYFSGSGNANGTRTKDGSTSVEIYDVSKGWNATYSSRVDGIRTSTTDPSIIIGTLRWVISDRCK